MAGGGNAAILIQQFQHRHAPARIVKYALGVFIRQGRVVRPALGPVGAHGDEGAAWDSPMTLLPRVNIVQCQHVVGILGRLLVNIDHHERHQHVFGLDLIDSVQRGVKVRRRIDMRTPLTDVAVLVDPKPILVDGVQGFDAFIRRALPMRNPRRKRMRQIDEAMRLNDRERIGQRSAGRLIGGACTQSCSERRSATGAQHPCSHEFSPPNLGNIHTRLACWFRRQYRDRHRPLWSALPGR